MFKPQLTVNQHRFNQSQGFVPMGILGKKLSIIYIVCIFSIVAVTFPQLLKQRLVLLHSILPTTSQLLQALQGKCFWKCYINVVTWLYSRFYWYICTLPCALLGVMCIYQSIPSRPCYNILLDVENMSGDKILICSSNSLLIHYMALHICTIFEQPVYVYGFI